MDLIQQLGVNHTYFFQFGIFLITIILLPLVFKDFATLLDKRNLASKGGEDVAGDFTKNLQELNAKYEIKAREINSQIQKIYTQYRSEAHEEQENILNKSRVSANQLLEQTRTKVAHEISEATRRLTDEIPAVAQAISQKLLSKSGKN